MIRPWEKQETDSVKWTKNRRFQEQKWAGIEDLYGGLRGGADGSPTAYWYNRRALFFPHILHPDHSKHAFLLFPVGLYCFYSKEWCCSETHCLSQEAADGDALAAQVAHNYCRWYSFLLPGHERHFLRHWIFFKTSSSIFTKHLVKNCS